jgi:hypothetical protein
MLDTEREARGLVSDPSSWSQGGVKRKAYRAMALTPEEESHRHRASRKGKKKHVHEWGEWSEEGRAERRPWVRGTSGDRKPGRPYAVIKWVRVCKKCGYRDKGVSTVGGSIETRRWWYF